ncbi:MAG TPA: hypothetical protein VM285_04805, partial [Polyangia bacterium]|nr:hypothetical protein [Polyangia bacterium]
GDGGVDREQFYIEGVSHTWNYTSKATTTLTVTRGFVGSDEELVDAVVGTQGNFARRGIGDADGLNPGGEPRILKSALGLGRDEEIV